MPKLEPLERAFKLEESASAMNRQYYRGIGKSALTVISGMAAVIAFLVNSHHVGYIQEPAIVRRSLYVLFAAYGVAYIATLVGERIYSMYTASVRDYYSAQATGESDHLLDRLDQMLGTRLAYVNFIDGIAEAAAAVGTIALSIFLIALLHTIVNQP